MTYQRYMGRSEEVLDEEVEEAVERAEVGGRDGDEEDRDRRRLDQRLAVRPLDPLELGPAGHQEADHHAALALGRGLPALAALLRLLDAAPTLALRCAPGAPRDPIGRLGLLDGRRGLGPPDVGAGRRRRDRRGVLDRLR